MITAQLLVRFLRQYWFPLLVLSGLATFLAVHLVWYIRPSNIKSAEDLEARLKNGNQPTVVEFYSNLWTICTVTKPIVDGIEADLEGQADVLRIDILSDVGREVARDYSVRVVPTFVVFDSEGQVLLRQSGKPDADEVRRAVSDWYANR